MAASGRTVARRLGLAPVVCGLALACNGGPASPSTTLPVGRWTGQGACLAVADAQCNLAVGCGHGQFPRPAVRSDGTFDVDGTYRIEVGPISVDPAPPAHFSGSVSGDVVTLTVVPTAPGLSRATYTMRATAAGGCPVPCL